MSCRLCLEGSRGSSASPICSRKGSHQLFFRVTCLTTGVSPYEEEEAEEDGQEVEVQQEEYLGEYEQQPWPEEIWQPAEPAVRDIPSTRAELQALGRTLFGLLEACRSIAQMLRVMPAAYQVSLEGPSSKHKVCKIHLIC